MNLPHVLKQLPQLHYGHVVPEIVSPSLPNVDEVLRDLRKAVSMNLKSKVVEIPVRDLFSRQDEGVKEIYELWAAVIVQMATKTGSKKQKQNGRLFLKKKRILACTWLGEGALRGLPSHLYALPPGHFPYVSE